MSKIVEFIKKVWKMLFGKKTVELQASETNSTPFERYVFVRNTSGGKRSWWYDNFLKIYVKMPYHVITKSQNR